MKSELILLLLVCSMTGSSQNEKTRIVAVEPYMHVTHGAFFKQLTLCSKDGDIDFIQGFEYEWGYFYELKIAERKIKQPPADASDTEYILLKILSKRKVPENYQFKLLLDKDLYLGPGEPVSTFKPINDSTYLYFDQIAIEVDPTLRKAFGKIMFEGDVRYGQCEFISTNKIKLIKLD